jgi:hypothetical protein
MPVFKGSRYEGVEYDAIRDNTGQVRRILHPPPRVALEELENDFQVLPVQAGDELDMLAFKFSGAERRWFVIADLNDIDFAWDLSDFKEIVVPDEAGFARLGK